MKRPHGGAGDPALLDFSENVNFLGPPPEVLQVLADAARHVGRYPSADAAPLREAIEASSLVAEARTLALLEAAVVSRRSGRPSTGTGTDCIVVASPLGRRKTPFAGKHTEVGHVVGAAVSDAVRRVVAARLAEQPPARSGTAASP